MDRGKALARGRRKYNYMREVDMRVIKREETWAENERNITPKWKL